MTTKQSFIICGFLTHQIDQNFPLIITNSLSAFDWLSDDFSFQNRKYRIETKLKNNELKTTIFEKSIRNQQAQENTTARQKIQQQNIAARQKNQSKP